jgi:GntR family transcriptional regulator
MSSLAFSASRTKSVRPGTVPENQPVDWRPDFASIRGRIYLAIALQIEEAIRLGILRPGDRLPSQRAISEELGFHVNTINAAFREAAHRGLIRSAGRRGSMVQ